MIRVASTWFFALLLPLSLYGQAAVDPSSTWVFDSITPQPSPFASSTDLTDTHQVYSIILDQVRYWNAHDIEHYMDLFWKSPDLLVITDAEQVMGWAELLAAYQRGYHDRSEMGTVTLQRVKLQKLSPEFFLGLSWYAVRTHGKDSFASDTMIFRKFQDGWKVINSHSSFLQP
jgi:hypothetical protein